MEDGDETGWVKFVVHAREADRTLIDDAAGISGRGTRRNQTVTREIFTVGVR
jgi:hypothetical protein